MKELVLTDKSQRYLQKATDLGVSLSLLGASGLPTKKNEDYKYTNLENVLFDDLKIATAKPMKEAFSKIKEELPAGPCLVFSNGEYQSELSQLPVGLSIIPQKQKSECSDPFEELNIEVAPNSYALTIEKGKKIPVTHIVHILNGNTSDSFFTSLSIQAESSSESSFLELFLCENENKTQSFTLTNITCEANAKVSHTKAVLTHLAHTHVGKVKADLERDAHLYSLTFCAAGSVNRNNIEININGVNAHATANGLYTARGEQHQDNFSHIHHRAAHTTSHQVFKGIMDDNSRGVFTGKIVIHRDAQQVDSSQLNKNLLLSQKAHVDTRPQIEVYADDVKCGHGATVGQINPEEVFYLESRGIERSKAQKILCHAFAQEVIDSCPDKFTAKFLSDQLFKHFEKYALEKLGAED